MQRSDDWREAIRLAPDPHTASHDRWVASLPAGVSWSRLDDRLIGSGWYPKNAISHLCVYGCDGGHEIVIDRASRQVVFRIATNVAHAERALVADALAHTLIQGAQL